MKHTARNAALQALLKVTENEGYSNIVIDKAIAESGLDRRDSALASALFYGTLEKRITLDFYLSKNLRDSRKKLDTVIQEILRCAAYQILFMDKIPVSAAVNEAVNMARAFRKPAYAGFINGVLRGLIRNKPSISLPQGSDDMSLSIRYSIPQELIALWRRAYGGPVLIELLEAFSTEAATYIRLNNIKGSPESIARALTHAGLQFSRYPGNDQTGILQTPGKLTDLKPFQEGLFHVQDLSAQLVCELLAPKAGELVVDCCAAPGGKTFTFAEMMRDNGQVLAYDLYKGRVKLVKQGAERLGLRTVTAGLHDATKPYPVGIQADKVLCDVPCSGFGVIRKKPEIRYKKLSSVSGLPALQLDILQNAASLVKPGGLLLYSTCTLNPAENIDVAMKFLDKNKNFATEKIDLPASINRIIDEPAHMFTMMPFAGASDGFFAALFCKKN